jgi:uncharacterized protein (TIGR02147 family)
MSKKIDIADFNDYRAFLKARIRELKAEKSAISHAYIAQRLKLTRGFVTLLLQGKRHLGPDKISKFWKILHLTAWEKEFFVALYLRTAVDDPELRDYFDSVCGALKMERAQHGDALPKTHRYRADEFQTITDPLYATLMLLTRFKGFDPEPKWVLKHLRDQAIAPESITQKYAELSKRGLLAERKRSDGRISYELPDKLLRQSSAHAQQSASSLAASSIAKLAEAVDHYERYTPMTNWVVSMALDENQHLDLLKLLGDFEKQVSTMSDAAKNPQRVVHISLHFLTLASPPKETR